MAKRFGYRKCRVGKVRSQRDDAFSHIQDDEAAKHNRRVVAAMGRGQGRNTGLFNSPGYTKTGRGQGLFSGEPIFGGSNDLMHGNGLFD